MRTVPALLMLAMLAQSGCERPRKPIQRFVSVEEPHHEGVALDTATGILCRTWDWHYNSNAPSDATGGLDDLKLCYELYKEDPINSE